MTALRTEVPFSVWDIRTHCLAGEAVRADVLTREREPDIISP